MVKNQFGRYEILIVFYRKTSQGELKIYSPELAKSKKAIIKLFSDLIDLAKIISDGKFVVFIFSVSFLNLALCSI